MPIQELTPERFRRVIAGLAETRTKKKITRETKESCAGFLSLMPKVFGKDLERMTMWTRISNGIQASLSKCGGSLDLFVQEMLKYVHADPAFLTSKVCLLNDIKELSEISSERDIEAEYLECFRHRNMLLIPIAKDMWDQEKKRMAKEKENE